MQMCKYSHLHTPTLTLTHTYTHSSEVILTTLDNGYDFTNVEEYTLTKQQYIQNIMETIFEVLGEKTYMKQYVHSYSHTHSHKHTHPLTYSHIRLKRAVVRWVGKVQDDSELCEVLGVCVTGGDREGALIKKLTKLARAGFFHFADECVLRYGKRARQQLKVVGLSEEEREDGVIELMGHLRETGDDPVALQRLAYQFKQLTITDIFRRSAGYR